MDCFTTRESSANYKTQSNIIVAAVCQESSRERHPTLQGSDLKSQFKLEAASWLDCFSPGCIRRTPVCRYKFSHIYGPTLFGALEFVTTDSQLTLSGVMNICQLLAVTVALFVIDKIGRRPLLMIGSGAMATSLFIVGIMVARFSYDWTINVGPAYVGVAFIFVYMLSFGLGWGAFVGVACRGR